MSGNEIFKPHNVAAWSLKEKQRPVVVDSAPYTPPPENHVVVKVQDVAINPIDWLVQREATFELTYPNILGLDVAGEIVEVGKNVEDFKIGQRVIAYCKGFNKDNPSTGAFQKYTVVPTNRIAELPYDIPASTGVVLPLGISTAAAGLYQEGYLDLPFPDPKGKPEDLDRTLLIWGGSSSVGSCAIQMAVASGATVITTASPSNFDYCKKLGASKCFDYHDDDIEDQIVDALKGVTGLGAFHAVGAGDAVKICGRILARTTGKAILVTVRGVPEGIPGEIRTKVIGSSAIFDNDVGPYIWRKFLPTALENGTVVPKPDPLIVGEELRSVQAGLDKQRKGVSARKVVITNIS